MSIGSILPLLIFILFLAGIFAFNQFMKKSAIAQKLNVKWVFGIYGLLLICAVFISAFLPVNENKYNVVGKEQIDAAKRAEHQFFTAISEGKRIDDIQIDGLTRMKQWDFPLKGKSIEMIYEEGEYGYYSNILIERKSENDGKIEVSQYQTNTILNNIDLTSHVNPHIVELEEERLLIKSPPEEEINIVMFEKEFTTNQFSNKKSTLPNLFDHDNDTYGQSLIYIRIPKDIHVTGNEEEFEFVRE